MIQAVQWYNELRTIKTKRIKRNTKDRELSHINS